LVSQAGEYIFIPETAFNALLDYSLDPSSDTGLNLNSKHIIAGSDIDAPVELLATKLRTRKGYLRNFTTLHMVVLTYCCNCQCDYCQASSIAPSETGLHMSRVTARKVVDSIFCSPSPSVKIEFQGGEPTLNWDVLKGIVEYAEHLNRRKKKRLEFVLCSNLIHIDEGMVDFLARHKVLISTSLDGPPDVHELHRVCRDGASSYEAFCASLRIVRQAMGQHSCSPLCTITKSSLGRLKDVIDEYLSLGFNGIFLRPVNPYGRARTQWDGLSSSVEEFVRAYRAALQYIIEINVKGTFFVEYYAALMLTRILTPFSTGFMDVQSPAGAGIMGVIYDSDGSVYPTDEARMLARMGDATFRLGNVLTDSYEEIFLGAKLRDLVSSSCVESLPGCAWCAYNLYCGSDPIRYFVECGDVVGHRPTSEFCMRNTGILDYLFEMLEDDDNATRDVFWSWLTNRGLEAVRV